MFVVRYDYNKQPELKIHTDTGHISFNILLNDEFEGGGTRFITSIGDEIYNFTVKPQKGQVLLHSARIKHEGLKITNGTRYILVGFLNVDRVDPFTGLQTGLNWFASWFSVNWLSTTMREGYFSSHTRLLRGDDKGFVFKDIEVSGKKWSDNKYIRSLLKDVHVMMEAIANLWSSFHFADLIHDDNILLYLSEMDKAYSYKQIKRTQSTGNSKQRTLASWFAGQQLKIDIDGKISNLWSTRGLDVDNQFEFKDL